MEDEAAAAAAGDEAEAPPAPKRKLSRKAQIKELAKRKKERSDAHYQPDVQAAEAADDDAELPDLPVEQPGEAAKRAANAYKKRRSRLRGLGSDAQFTPRGSLQLRKTRIGSSAWPTSSWHQR